MAYPSPVFPRNSLSCEKEKVPFFRRSQILLHGSRDNRPPPSLIPFSFPLFSFVQFSFSCITFFFLSLPLSLFSRYFCLSAAFFLTFLFIFSVLQNCFFHFLSGFVLLLVEKYFLVGRLPPINFFQPYSCSFLFLFFCCFVFVFATFPFFLPSPYICQLPTAVLLYHTVFCGRSRQSCVSMFRRSLEASFFSSRSRISFVFVQLCRYGNPLLVVFKRLN